MVNVHSPTYHMDLLKIKKAAEKRLTNDNIKGRVVYLIKIKVQNKVEMNL